MRLVALALAAVMVLAIACGDDSADTPRPAQTPFELSWTTSASSVAAGESFTLTVRMNGLQHGGEHGGISVSFPSLTQSGGSGERHSSSVADVEALDYTSGLSRVAFHQPGATIYHRENNRRFPANHLLVESDDPSWSKNDERTLVLRITPRFASVFPIRIRGWLCADEYTDCARVPASGTARDQQGWIAERVSVSVAARPSSAAGLIAFYSSRNGNGDIYVMNGDGSDVRRLTYNEAMDWLPRWSPDGRRIAFVSRRDDTDPSDDHYIWNIYIMNADGSDVRRLTNNEASDSHLRWSPDGRRIVFESNRDDPDPGDDHRTWNIYVMNADGSDQTRLTNNEAIDTLPRWSPDGRRTAFESNRDDPDAGDDHRIWNIYVMNADGSDVRRLTNNEASDWGLRWSPDGRRIAFNSNRDDNYEIYVMDADGSNARRLTHNEATDWMPSWSPSSR